MLALACAEADAQGSTGGSIGNDNKSLSGASEPSRPARRKAERAEPRTRSRGNGGGDVSRFDGIWVVRAFGQSAVCAGATSSNTVTVSGGRISGNNVQSGSVSASGALQATGGSRSATNITTGRLSGRSGGGSFRQSDGCTGRWTASKQ